MAVTETDLEFHFGEYVEIVLLAKDPDGTTLSTPASQVVSFTVSNSDGSAPLLEWDTGGAKVTLTDAGAAEFTVQLLPTDYNATLDEERWYYYNFWSELGAQPLLQAKGRIAFRSTVEPS